MKKRLTFEKEDGKWYIVLPHWIGSKSNLQMVAGADTLLEALAGNPNVKTLSADIYTNYKMVPRKGYIEFERTDCSLLGGADYQASYFNPSIYPKTMWLCPVTLFVYHKYPNLIGIDTDTIECTFE